MCVSRFAPSAYCTKHLILQTKTINAHSTGIIVHQTVCTCKNAYHWTNTNLGTDAKYKNDDDDIVEVIINIIVRVITDLAILHTSACLMADVLCLDRLWDS